MADHDLTITRVFDAPRELVFDVWTDPDHLARWFGPEPFTAGPVRVRLAEGGAWRACIRSAELKMERWVRGVYHEIRRPERLVFSFAWEEPKGSPGHDTLCTVTLADHDGKTEMTFHQAIFETVEDRDGHVTGWRSSFEDLASYLEELT